MRRNLGIVITVFLFCVVLIGPGQCLTAEGGLRYSIAVAKFNNKSNWRGQWNLGDAWGAVLTDSLNQTGRFIVLGEKDMRREALSEQDFAASGRAAGGGKKVVTGQMTPAQLLIKGDITHFADGTKGGGGSVGIAGFRIGGGASTAEINVIMYIIDSTTGQVVASKKCYGKISKTGFSLGVSAGGFSGDIGGFKKTNAGKAMEMAVDQGVGFLESQLENIPWTGTVILSKGNKVYINRGKREGVTVGQTFDVGKADVLRDPDTGEILDQSLDKVGTIQVIKVKKKIAICKVTQGQGMKKGMTVIMP
ncbi:MAG: CsgG/HfaB family protein [Thermodesulfobacteriota bacterium]|nr:CsgG/HfaB family protein [Thermodesulfobacteriota bacterium]